MRGGGGGGGDTEMRRNVGLLVSARTEITVLYPSVADWSESPPYSALPRPGSRATGK